MHHVRFRPGLRPWRGRGYPTPLPTTLSVPRTVSQMCIAVRRFMVTLRRYDTRHLVFGIKFATHFIHDLAIFHHFFTFLSAQHKVSSSSLSPPITPLPFHSTLKLFTNHSLQVHSLLVGLPSGLFHGLDCSSDFLHAQ